VGCGLKIGIVSILGDAMQDGIADGGFSYDVLPVRRKQITQQPHVKKD